jgi:hypothetical protein
LYDKKQLINQIHKTKQKNLDPEEKFLQGSICGMDNTMVYVDIYVFNHEVLIYEGVSNKLMAKKY